MEKLEERSQGGLREEKEERERVWGKEFTRRKRRREWDVMGWENCTLNMEEAAPRGEETVGDDDKNDGGGIMMEGGRVGDVSSDGNDVIGGGSGDWRGRQGGEGDSVVKSHKAKQPTERRKLTGRRRGVKHGLGEGVKERMATLLKKWMDPSTCRAENYKLEPGNDPLD